MADQQTADSNVASHTLVWMRRIDGKVDLILDHLVSQEKRLSHVEREIGELRNAYSSIEGRMLKFTTELFTIRENLETRMAHLEDRMDRLERMVEGVARAVDAQGGKIDMILQKLA